MNNAQQPYSTDENSIDELSFNPTQAQESLSDFVDDTVKAETPNAIQQAKQRFSKSVNLLSLNTHRQKIIVFGGISAAFLIAFFLGWRIIAPYFSHPRPSESFQFSWLDNETTQQTPQLEHTELSTLEPSASPQPTESNDSIARHKPEMEPLMDEIVQIKVRVDELEKKVNEFKLMAKPQIANVSDRKTLAKRPIVSAQQVHQTHSTPRIHQSHRLIRLKPVKRAMVSHNVAIVGQDRQISQKVTSAAQPVLQLKAVLEGRAWLQTKGGESITVAVGETVPGLGVVKAIDVDQAQIIFSNGLVLR